MKKSLLIMLLCGTTLLSSCNMVPSLRDSTTNYYHASLDSSFKEISKEEFLTAQDSNLKKDSGYDYVSVEIILGNEVAGIKNFYANATVDDYNALSNIIYTISFPTSMTDLSQVSFLIRTITTSQESLIGKENSQFFKEPYCFKGTLINPFEVIYDDNFLVQEINIKQDDKETKAIFNYFNENDLTNRSGEVDKRTYLDCAYAAIQNSNKKYEKVDINYSSKNMIFDIVEEYDPVLDSYVIKDYVYSDSIVNLSYSIEEMQGIYKNHNYLFRREQTEVLDGKFNYFYFENVLGELLVCQSAYNSFVSDERLTFLGGNDNSDSSTITYKINPLSVSIEAEVAHIDVLYDSYGLIKEKKYKQKNKYNYEYSLNCKFK